MASDSSLHGQGECQPERDSTDPVMTFFNFMFFTSARRNSLKTSVLGSTLCSVLLFLCLAMPSQADSTPISNLEQNNLTESMPTVDELSDVEPDTWAFVALQSLVNRYNCLAGNPEGRSLEQRALPRFEFAAGLNACLLGLEQQIGLQSAGRSKFSA